MTGITCVRCGQVGDQIAAPPFPTELGTRLYESVCDACWALWLKEQTAIINHYALNVLDPKAKQFLTTQTEAFFFGADQE